MASMTGYASVRGRAGDRSFLLEAKSLNHRFCEVNVRLPGKYSSWEHVIQKAVRMRFQRGRFDIFIKEEGGQQLSSADLSQFRQAHQQLKRLSKDLQLKDGISLDTLLHFKQQYFRDDDHANLKADWAVMQPLVDKLLDRLEKMRLIEGRQLSQWYQQRLVVMDSLLAKLKGRVKVPPRLQRERLTKRLKELGLMNEEGKERLSAEVALISDKMEVTEELVRLASHFKAFRGMLKEKGPIGRKIDFLMQEVGREVNTIAAKSQDSTISDYTVQLKTEIEKIREQAGNVE